MRFRPIEQALFLILDLVVLLNEFKNSMDLVVKFRNKAAVETQRVNEKSGLFDGFGLFQVSVRRDLGFRDGEFVATPCKSEKVELLGRNFELCHV